MSELTEMTEVQTKRDFVLSIAQNRGWVEPRIRERTDRDTLILLRTIARIREELGETVAIIAQEIGSRRARFILELIQNADDNDFTITDEVPSLSFEVFPDKVIVECNEDGFEERNVTSICRTGRSSKSSTRGYIGEKGIGFKSVFQVASKVHIQSNSYSFSFHYDGSSSGESKLGIITPIPEDEVLPLSGRPLTRMTLTPKDNLSYSDLVAQFKDVPKDLLLFLSKLGELKFTIHESNGKTSILKFSKSEDTETHAIVLKKTLEDPDHPADADRNSIDIARYKITRRSVGDLPPHTSRIGITECEVVLAFPVDGTSQPVIRPQNAFAFLPIRDFGFHFLIQADFIVEASRQDVVDIPRNKAILKGVAEAFCDAVLEFCNSDSPLRMQWMKYLPSPRGDSLWKDLPLDIIRLLEDRHVLYPLGSSQARLPRQLRVLPEATHLDMSGSPLFGDLAENRTYLSTDYSREDTFTLRQTFRLLDIGDYDMYLRIKEDLQSASSKMKSPNTDENWHSRAASLISSIYDRNAGLRIQIKALQLIPLSDGRWVNASMRWHFPAQRGAEIPADLMATVDSIASGNTARKQLFERLGVTGCSRRQILDMITDLYSRNGGASDMSSSKAHVKFLYWHNDSVNDYLYPHIWLYDAEGRKVTPVRKVLYFPSEDEYSPQQLLRSVSHPRDPTRMTLRCQVPFLNSAYLDLYPSSTHQGGRSWLAWLEQALGVRTVPRLKTDGGSISSEFRYIMEYQPQKLIMTLKKNWHVYKDELEEAVEEALSQAKVPCSNGKAIVLKDTYAPLPALKTIVLDLGITRGFAFVEVGEDLTQGRSRRDWRFLQEFGVAFEANLRFYVEILRQHGTRTQGTWNETTRTNILKTYEAIADHCSDNDIEWLRESLDGEFLILDPSSFQQDASGPTWTDIDSCVWNGPENLLDKKPLAAVRQYDTEKLANFFKQALGIRDANWTDYVEMIVKIQDSQIDRSQMQEKLRRLYDLLSDVRGSRVRASIRERFELDRLIFVPSTDALWFSPSNCLWTSPVPIEGKAIIADSYSENFREFFVEFLGIAPAGLSTLVFELGSLAARNPSIERVTRLIWAVNAMRPEPGDLDSLMNLAILPIRCFDQFSNAVVSLQSPETEFAINDRNAIARVFKHNPRAALLDFTLEEVRQLDPFIQALGLGNNFLSLMYGEETACEGEGMLDSNLTAKFRERAHDLLRCAYANQSPLTTRNPQVLYQLLLNASIRLSDRISTKHTLHFASGDIEVFRPGGYVHILLEDSLKIFVPRDRKDRELCYVRNLPGALGKLFQVPVSVREILGLVLNSSSFVIDELLEAEGIGMIPNIPAPPRLVVEESREVVLATENEAASPRPSQPQSLQLLSLRRTALQAEDGPDFRRNRSSSLDSTELQDSNRSTPSTGSFDDPALNFPLRPADQFYRSPAPEGVQDHRSVLGAYSELLENIIQIAARTLLPHRSYVPRIGDGQIHDGFDHDAAFGVRSQGQLSHDIKIGAAGELFAFEILLRILPSVSRENWKSRVRNEVTVHPKYNDMDAWRGAETADIVYQDSDNILTGFLVELGYLESFWIGARPKYLIEVKTTTGECKDRFFMSNSQYLRMQRMALPSDRTAAEIYIVFRVYNLTKDSVNLKIYVDPEAHRRENTLLFGADSWTVTPV